MGLIIGIKKEMSNGVSWRSISSLGGWIFDRKLDNNPGILPLLKC